MKDSQILIPTFALNLLQYVAVIEVYEKCTWIYIWKCESYFNRLFR